MGTVNLNRFSQGLNAYSPKAYLVLKINSDCQKENSIKQQTKSSFCSDNFKMFR